MAASSGTLLSGTPAEADQQAEFTSDNEADISYQGPHDWRKRLKPVKSPIKDGAPEVLINGETRGTTRSRPLPPWKRDLIERNKKVARLVRRESSGRSKVVRRESSGRSKKSELPSSAGIGRKKSFRNAQGTENTFTQQVVNETPGLRRRISPHNSFKSASGIRRTPSDKGLLDPNDPNTKKRVERVRRARLYLLQQMGPNSFQIVGDSPEHKFKVIIGPQTCSCGRGPQCVHVLFVMLRVFQVSETEPCLWSKQLKNYEVENLFRIYNDKRKLRIEAKKLKRNHKLSADMTGSSTPSPEASQPPSEGDSGSVREEDDTCPICLLEMLEGESLLRCEGCQNRLHHHCITVWFEECKRQNERYICPLCRSRWKQSDAEVKTEDGNTERPATDSPMVPPNTRVPSPQHEVETSRLPYAEPIPGEYINMATPWIELLGEDLVSCLFSRNWSIRETGLKHLAREMSRELARATSGESWAGGMSLANTTTMVRYLECCFNVVAFVSQDPVYKVFVGCLKVLRSMFAVTPSRDHQQRTKLQTLFRPVVDAIVVKCTDGNRRTSQLSISTILELAKGQHGELTVGRDLSNPGTLGLGGMAYLVRVLTEKYDPVEVSWQWLLGRLYIIEKLVTEFPTEFLPRQRPDGASSESSLELIGATSGEEEERPQNYDRLLVVAQFTIKAVSNRHQRISRVAKRVFLLAARYAAHLDSLIAECESLIAELEYSHKKSLRRQLDKIVADFALSEKLGRQLLHTHDDFSPMDTPNETPLSSPRCSSPVTTISDNQSECGQQIDKNHPIVPPNTPIRDRRQHARGEHFRRSFDLVEEERFPESKSIPKMRACKSLDNLDFARELKPLSLPSKSGTQKKSKKARSRSNTPQRIGPVLETNLDEVIKREDEKKLYVSRDALDDINDTANSDMDLSLNISHIDNSKNDDMNLLLSISLPSVSPPLPRLLSHDIETDIDSDELNLAAVAGKVQNNSETVQAPVLVPKRNLLRNPKCNSAHLPETPKLRHKIPKSLSLNLDLETLNPWSVSPNSRVEQHENWETQIRDSKLMKVSETTGAVSSSQTPVHNSLAQSKSLLPTTSVMRSENSCKTFTATVKERADRCKSSEVCKTKDSAQGFSFAVYDERKRRTPPSQKSEHTESLLKYMATTPCSGNDKPVTFQTEVAMATPKHSPSHTLDKDEEDCYCKEEVEKEEALALARAMELSSKDPPKPVVPGLTPMDQEEVITIRIQPDECDAMDSNGNPPTLYYENVHWMKGPLLGTGAFSTCYQARDVETGTIMALKQISFCRNSKTEQENVIETITEEIHMMAKLNHPHIVRILGATRQGCHFNMFVEWMPGGSVSYLLGQYGCFSEEVITSYVLQILRGLTYLHENHILHRDLKGANLLVDSTGHRLRIGDFGAAARLASKATGAGEFQGQLLGTIAFMAPEVLRGEDYGRACDVWSIGCCVIEMATTKPPWNAHDISNHLALIFKIANSQSTPPVPEKLSPPLRDVLLRCLETVKEHRPTAKELLIHPLFTQYMQKKKGTSS